MVTILYQDGDCVAAMKSTGVAAVPERRDDTVCLRALLEDELGRPVFPVHRLDKEVSGVILYALTADAHRFFNAAFEQRRVHKTYLAVVHGRMGPERGAIVRPIREFGSGRMGVDDARGKRSETRYEVAARSDLFSLVWAVPLTGRRHQLRVHLYSLGHPIAGDLRYGGPEQRQGHPRLMLTAVRLALRLPSGGPLDLRAAPPEDFLAAAEARYGLSAAACSGLPSPSSALYL